MDGAERRRRWRRRRLHANEVADRAWRPPEIRVETSGMTVAFRRGASGFGCRAKGLADMKGQSLLGGRLAARAAKLSAASVAVVGLGAMSGCLNAADRADRSAHDLDRRRAAHAERGQQDRPALRWSTTPRRWPTSRRSSRTAVPDLIGGLVNPPCVDDTNGSAAPGGRAAVGPDRRRAPPASKRAVPAHPRHPRRPDQLEPRHLRRRRLPGHGEHSCPGNAPNTSNNDHGHLVTRTDPCSGRPSRPTRRQARASSRGTRRRC